MHDRSKSATTHGISGSLFTLIQDPWALAQLRSGAPLSHSSGKNVAPSGDGYTLPGMGTRDSWQTVVWQHK